MPQHPACRLDACIKSWLRAVWFDDALLGTFFLAFFLLLEINFLTPTIQLGTEP